MFWGTRMKHFSVYRRPGSCKDPEKGTKELGLRAERRSIETCLRVCRHFSDRPDDVQYTVEEKRAFCDPKPDLADRNGLRGVRKSLISSESKLEGHMKALLDRMLNKLRVANASQEDITGLEGLRDEWEITCECRRICIRMGKDIDADVTKISNYAQGDVIQFIVSTDGNPIEGENKGLGSKTGQVGGHMSDASLQQVVRDMDRTILANTGNEPLSNTTEENERISGFEKRHGRGFRMPAQ